jgi:PAS domain-containing protein
MSKRRKDVSGLRPTTAAHLAVLEASPNAVIAIDDQRRIIYVNPQAETTFGYARGDLIGQPVELLIPARPMLSSRWLSSIRCSICSRSRSRRQLAPEPG